MRRTQIYLEDHQDRLLEERAKSLGVTKSAVIRDAIDAFLEGSAGRAAADVQRFRTAVAQAAGIASYLPSGGDYVDALRAADAEREQELRERRRR